MATASASGPLGHPIRFHEEDYPFWTENLHPDTRRELLEEDLLAGESVAAEMLAIIGTGIAMAVLTVWLICR